MAPRLLHRSCAETKLINAERIRCRICIVGADALAITPMAVSREGGHLMPVTSVG